MVMGFFFNLIGSQREEGATRAGEEDGPREGGGRGEEGGAREGDARPSERTEEAAYGAGVGDGRADGPAPCGLRHPVKGERPPEEFLYFKWENYGFDTHHSLTSTCNFAFYSFLSHPDSCLELLPIDFVAYVAARSRKK